MSYYNVLQLPTVGDAKIHNSRRSRVVYFTDDTPHSEAELCVHQIHHEAKLSCVSAHTPRNEAELCMLAYPYSKQLLSWRTILYNDCCVFCRWR